MRIAPLVLLLVPLVAVAGPRAAPSAGWESGAYSIAAGLGVVAALLIGFGIVMGMLRKMLTLAKIAIGLGVLTVLVAIGTAAALIWAF